jgi:hypothetical protein
MIRYLALLALSCAALGCAGMRGLRPVSAPCHERIDRCLADCPPEPRLAEVMGDSRTACESHCGDLCFR